MSRRKPPPQEIVRGPAVQGHSQQERRESPDAGAGGARIVGESIKARPERPRDKAPAPEVPVAPPARRRPGRRPR